MAMMTSYDDYEDIPTLTDHLAKQLVRQRLALVLGSGISKPFGLPEWKGLMKSLYEMQGESSPASGEPTQQAEDFRLRFFKNDTIGFHEAVRQALYQDLNIGFKQLRENLTLAAIASLVMSSKRGSTSHVITFNYDNLLEIYLAYHGYVTKPVSDEVHWASEADVTIYHPHGFLPYGKSLEPSANLVIDRESYDQILGKDLPWRQLMLTLMRTHTCLFIGLSGDDFALTSLLNDVKKIHAVTDSTELFWGVCFTTNSELKARWESRKVFCRTIGNYERELPDILFGVCQAAAQILGIT